MYNKNNSNNKIVSFKHFVNGIGWVVTFYMKCNVSERGMKYKRARTPRISYPLKYVIISCKSYLKSTSFQCVFQHRIQRLYTVEQNVYSRRWIFDLNHIITTKFLSSLYVFRYLLVTVLFKLQK